jgi:hypothetical protein
MVYSNTAIAFTDLNGEMDQLNKIEIENYDLIPLFQVDSIMTLYDSLADDDKEIQLHAESTELNGAKLKTQDSIRGNQRKQINLQSSSFRQQVSQRLNTSKVKNAIKITTALDGYNSGREYLLQTESADKCIKMSNELSKRYKEARDEFAFNSKWNKAQEKMRIAYSSNWVQGFVGASIMLVSL